MIAFILSLVLHVASGERINDALDSARAVYAARQERTTIYIAPGTYQEELTIDVPGLTLKNASKKPSIALWKQGVEADPEAVRITWYYGHGYQYRSMGDTPNYGGSRTRKWNASVLVSAPDFYAENIIFENSFNLYVSEKEAQDSLVDISQSDLPWTEKERPKKVMPQRPKEVGSTEVAKRAYRERAAAISFTETAKNAHLKNCTAIGKQDVLYGDQGASIYWEGGVLSGAVDFIFGAMTLCVDRATIIANITDEKGDKCYIAAGRSGSDAKGNQLDNRQSKINNRGMLFYKCHIQSPVPGQVWLARPWRAWGETVWAYTTWDEGVLNTEAWNTGLTKGEPCPNSYEYQSQDLSAGRPKWVTVLSKPILPDGTKLTPKNWK
jgi:pectin methylesterase-like acyl-CoA thioesterase